MPSEETNGHGESRLDRLELIVLDLGESQEKLMDSQKLLLHAQGVLYDETVKIAKQLSELAGDVDQLAGTVHELSEAQGQATENIKKLSEESAEFQKSTDERLNALINIVDDLVRKRPPQAP